MEPKYTISQQPGGRLIIYGLAPLMANSKRRCGFEWSLPADCLVNMTALHANVEGGKKEQANFIAVASGGEQTQRMPAVLRKGLIEMQLEGPPKTESIEIQITVTPKEEPKSRAER